MRSAASLPMFSVEYSREELPMLMSPCKVPDPDWRYVDKAGHGHFWKKTALPTLKWVVTGKTWIGDEYGGEEIELGEFRCKLCDEVIEPGKKLKHPEPLMGPVNFRVTFSLTDGGTDAYLLNEEEYVEALGEWHKVIKKKWSSRREDCGLTFRKTS